MICFLEPVKAVEFPDSSGSKPPDSGDENFDLKVLYTASLEGNLDGCSCKKIPKAGLVKRAYYLRSLTDRERVLLVDAGDILEYRHEDPLLTGYILEVYQDLKYDAVAVGDNEFSDGITKLLEYREKCPLLANNLSIAGGDDEKAVPFSKTPKILKKEGFQIGIFSLLDTNPELFGFCPRDIQKRVKIASLNETATNMITIFRRKKVDFTILLFHGCYDNAVLLAKYVPGIDLIVVGHEGRLVEAVKIGESVIVSPGDEGNRVGILELAFNNHQISGFRNNFRLFNYDSDPDDPAVRERINRYYDELTAKIKQEKSQTK